ncbi:MAG: UMP kinase [bacterium]|nr:UMP kinase [bacterium]
MSTFVISLGGSLVSPQAGKVDIVFLRKFRALILKYVRRGDRFAIIVGGGKVCRAWQGAARTLGVKNNENLDWVGIRATQLNAELVRAMFGNSAHHKVISNPSENIGRFKIVIGAGYVPGHSSDYDAVVRAKGVGANTVVNLSNVQYVYDKDPRKFKNAKILKGLPWKEYFKMFGTKWVPGANVPFDQKAAYEASQEKMRIAFIGGQNLKSFENFLQGKKFDGTIIG